MNPQPISFQLSETKPDPNEFPSFHYIEVSFKSPAALKYITFTNYYTAYVTIWWKPFGVVEDGNRGSWRIANQKHKLMTCPHCEDDAEAIHQLSTADWDADFDTSRVGGLRFYPLQPSTNWKQYTLRSVQCWTLQPTDEPEISTSSSLSAEKSSIQSESVDTKHILVTDMLNLAVTVKDNLLLSKVSGLELIDSLAVLSDLTNNLNDVVVGMKRSDS
ncbi:hypothetical protein GEMRC1_000596 [Eukaryota sp. GEM-RC1]